MWGDKKDGWYKVVVLEQRGQTSVDVAHERCGVAAVPFKAEERASAVVPFKAKEKASAYRETVEIRTCFEEKELVVEAGCEDSVVVETELRLTECST